MTSQSFIVNGVEVISNNGSILVNGLELSASPSGTLKIDGVPVSLTTQAQTSNNTTLIGREWHYSSLDAYGFGYGTIQFLGDKFIAPLSGGYSHTGNLSYQYSNNGITWSKSEFPDTPQINNSMNIETFEYGHHRIAYGNGKYVVAYNCYDEFNSGTSGDSITSTDGINWTRHSNVFPVGTSTKYGYTTAWRSIVFGNGKFVAMSGQSYWNYPKVFTSTDGISWTQTSPSVLNYYGWASANNNTGNLFAHIDDPGYYDSELYDMEFGNGTFIACGHWYHENVTPRNMEIVFTSEDANYWTQRNLPVAASWHRVAYGDGTFILLGSEASNSSIPHVLYSQDNGRTWKISSIPAGDYYCSGASFGEGTWIINKGGENGYALISTDSGKTFTNVDTGLVPEQVSQVLYASYYTDVAYGINQFITIGGTTAFGNNCISISKTTNKITTANWSIEQENSELHFKYNHITKAKLQANGNMYIAGTLSQNVIF